MPNRASSFANITLHRYIAHHDFTAFIIYRVGLGALLIVLLATGAIIAT